MRYYPAFLDLQGKRCVVVGGGAVAARKAEALLRAGGLVRVVAPEIGPEMRRLCGRPKARRGSPQQPPRKVEWHRARYSARDLDGAWLVLAATNEARVHEAVGRDAAERGLLCNLADSAAGSNFLAPAAFCRGDLQVAVSTCGAAPALARRVRRELEKMLGPEYGQLLALLRELRSRVMACVPAGRRRQQFRRMVNSTALDLLRQDRREEARRVLESFCP